jgi:hypothetical protein
MGYMKFIEDTKEAIKEFSLQGYGNEEVNITQAQLAEMKKGKLFAVSDGEYTTTIRLVD